MFLAAANWVAWATLLALRSPMAPEFFAERDRAQASGEVVLSSSDPALVLAGRPLWGWSTVHGGERWPVRVLEIVNVPSLLVVFVLDSILGVTGVAHHQRSMMSAALLFAGTAVQWLYIGLCVRNIQLWCSRGSAVL